jgi:hypothetical protein
MTMFTGVSQQINQVWQLANQLSSQDRLLLAKLLLDSVVSTEAGEESDWRALSLSAFEADWDNPDDAIYDNWRELYDVSER